MTRKSSRCLLFYSVRLRSRTDSVISWPILKLHFGSSVVTWLRFNSSCVAYTFVVALYCLFAQHYAIVRHKVSRWRRNAVSHRLISTQLLLFRVGLVDSLAPLGLFFTYNLLCSTVLGHEKRWCFQFRFIRHLNEGGFEATNGKDFRISRSAKRSLTKLV